MALKFAVNNSLSAITSLPSGISGGALNLISTQTASGSASLEFSLDDSYDSYVFKFINMHPANDNVQLEFNLSTDGGSNYNVTKTTTFFHAIHEETDGTEFGYKTAQDLAQSTSYQQIISEQGNWSDESGSGTLILYNPSSTTFVKHFISRVNCYFANNLSGDQYVAGYGNTSNSINSIKFQYSSGNIDDGIIKMYGVS